MSAQHRHKISRHLGHAISTIKTPLKTTLWLLYNDLYIKYKPKLVQYQNDIKFLPKFTPDGVTALWYLSRKFISNVLVNKVPRIREIIGSSTKFGKNRSKTKSPIFTWTYRTMRPPALEPVTLTAFIPLIFISIYARHRIVNWNQQTQ